MSPRFDFSTKALTGDDFVKELDTRQSTPKATPKVSGEQPEAADAGTPITQLRTSASAAGTPQIGVSAYSLSSILQGAGLYKPEALVYDQFNQQLSSDLQAIIATGGGVDTVLGARSQLTPYDVLLQQGVHDGKIQFDRGQAAANQQFADAGSQAPGGEGVVQNADGTETHDQGGALGLVTVILWTPPGFDWTFKFAPELMQKWQQLWPAAKADGLELRGGGFRTAAEQIALRKQNCPDWRNSKASACSPPTAPPGRSNHEKGLAVDLKESSTRGTRVYQWMAANAATYGLYNLPSEPWHWSVDGS